MKVEFTISLIVICITLALGGSSLAQTEDPIADWTFVPEYVLPGKAKNFIGEPMRHPAGHAPLVELETQPIKFAGEQPTQRLRHLLPPESIPRKQFSVETWMLHHVNQPVGMVIAAKGKSSKDAIPWTLGFNNWKTTFTMQNIEGGSFQVMSRMKKWGGFKQRWVHVVASYDGHTVKLYVNGEEVASGHMHHDEIAWPENVEFELASYMKNEPYMQWANLVHRVRLYDQSLSVTAINQNFAKLKLLVEEGKLYEDTFHFTAGPYLNYTTTDGIHVVWETDRDSKAVVEWGTTAKLGESLKINKLSRLQEARLTGLKANTPYFYRITCYSDTDEISSGLLTFKTAVEPHQPYKFAVIGDTESRPHINDRLCKLIWDERPNFVINLGDLTDGGRELHRYEWTHEYFVGMNQLTSRVPVFAVPGNGEGDLVWYKHYHDYPQPEGFYRFQFGDAAFFMLDSNQRGKEFAPGGKQYAWLEKQLESCDATWKFACHHHATYTGEEDDYGDTWKEGTTFGDPAVQQILPLYEKHRLDMVMFGHLHLFERSHPIRKGKVDFENGTIHLLAGGGGGNLEDFAPTPAFFSAKSHRGHHYVVIESQNRTLTMRMYDLNGSLRDFLILKKTAAGSVAVKRMEEAERSGSE